VYKTETLDKERNDKQYCAGNNHAIEKVAAQSRGSKCTQHAQSHGVQIPIGAGRLEKDMLEDRPNTWLDTIIGREIVLHNAQSYHIESIEYQVGPQNSCKSLEELRLIVVEEVTRQHQETRHVEYIYPLLNNQERLRSEREVKNHHKGNKYAFDEVVIVYALVEHSIVRLLVVISLCANSL
jgi:hypothetical protein